MLKLADSYILEADYKRQQGFSLAEVVVAMVVVAMLATAFLSAFSVVLRNSASPMQTALMEDVVAGQLDQVLSGTFQSAVAIPASATVNVGGTIYTAAFSSALVDALPAASAVHVTVTVWCDSCMASSTLSGDVYAIH